MPGATRLAGAALAVVAALATRAGARDRARCASGRLWVSEFNAGRLGRYDPARRRWREWKLPGGDPHPYAVYIDASETVWLNDFGEVWVAESAADKLDRPRTG